MLSISAITVENLAYFIRCLIFHVIVIDDYEDLSDHKEGISHDQHGSEREELHQPLVYNL